MLAPAFDARFEKSRRSPSREAGFFFDARFAAPAFLRAGALPAPGAAAAAAGGGGGAPRGRFPFASVSLSPRPVRGSPCRLLRCVFRPWHYLGCGQFSPAAAKTGVMSTGMSLSLAMAIRFPRWRCRTGRGALAPGVVAGRLDDQELVGERADCLAKLRASSTRNGRRREGTTAPFSRNQFHCTAVPPPWASSMPNRMERNMSPVYGREERVRVEGSATAVERVEDVPDADDVRLALLDRGVEVLQEQPRLDASCRRGSGISAGPEAVRELVEERVVEVRVEGDCGEQRGSSTRSATGRPLCAEFRLHHVLRAAPSSIPSPRRTRSSLGRLKAEVWTPRRASPAV